MKRTCCLLLSICMLAMSLGGCSGKKQDMTVADENLSVYASFYPIYALAEVLMRGAQDISLSCLVQPQDGCLRNYQISDWDAALIASADAMILGGSGLESFETAFYAMESDGPAVISALSGMELTTWKAINTQTDDGSHWLEPNPHIYMSVEGGLEILERLAAALTLLNPENQEIYAANLEEACRQMNDLRSDIDAHTASLKGEAVIVMNESLLYAAREYGLEIELCWERESGETIDGLDLAACLEALERCEAGVILLEKQAPQALCEALEAEGYCVASMDVLSTGKASGGFQAYLKAMRKNAQSVESAFLRIETNTETGE